jgi:hypothetical protein
VVIQCYLEIESWNYSSLRSIRSGIQTLLCCDTENEVAKMTDPILSSENSMYGTYLYVSTS